MTESNFKGLQAMWQCVGSSDKVLCASLALCFCLGVSMRNKQAGAIILRISYPVGTSVRSGTKVWSMCCADCVEHADNKFRFQ